MANLDEAWRQDVLEEAVDEGRGRADGEVSVLGLEHDGVIGDGDEPMVGDGDAVRVTPEVAVDVFGAAEGALAVDDPVFDAQLLVELFEVFAFAEEELSTFVGRVRGASRILPRNTLPRALTSKR